MIFGKNLDLWKLHKQTIISEAPNDLEIDEEIDDEEDEDELNNEINEYQLDEEDANSDMGEETTNKTKNSNEMKEQQNNDPFSTDDTDPSTDDQRVTEDQSTEQVDNNENSSDLDLETGGESSDNEDTSDEFNEEEPGVDDNAGLEEIEEQPEEDMDSETERLKKIVLLQQYKELVNLANELLFSVERLLELYEYKENEELDYVVESLERTKAKISFTVEQKFLSSKYIDLLKLFYYFKYGLNSLSIFIENIVKEKTK